MPVPVSRLTFLRGAAVPCGVGFLSVLLGWGAGSSTSRSSPRTKVFGRDSRFILETMLEYEIMNGKRKVKPLYLVVTERRIMDAKRNNLPCNWSVWREGYYVGWTSAGLPVSSI